MNAPEALLAELPAAITELKLVRAAAVRLMRGEVFERPVLSSWTQVLDYCRASMGFESKEQFRILFLDKRNQIIADEVQQKGTVDHTPVYVREVVKRALDLSATAIVLVHNHPSGDPTPSRADIEMTKSRSWPLRNLSASSFTTTTSSANKATPAFAGSAAVCRLLAWLKPATVRTRARRLSRRRQRSSTSRS